MAILASILAVALSVFGTACFGLALSQGSGDVAAIWPADAVQMTALLRSPRRRWPAFLAAGLIASTAANVAMGSELAIGAALSACNTLGILPSAFMLRKLYGASMDLSRRNDIIGFGLVAGLLCPAISATPAAFLLHWLVGADFATTWRKWFLAVDLGMFAVAPALMTILTRNGTNLPRLFEGAGRLKSIGLMLAVGAAAAGIFDQSSDQLLSLLFPLLLIATLDLGFAGAAVATFLVAMISIPLTIAGLGPFVRAGPVADRVLALQFFLTITVATTLPVAIVLAELRRYHAKLQRTTEQATEANIAKSAFLASMSHELRTPLNAVIGFAEVLLGDRRETLPERQRDYVELILRGGRQLLALVSDVLDFTDIEAGTLRLSLEDIALQDILDEVARTMMPVAKEKGVSISVAPGQGAVPAVPVDRIRLIQILMNLISNAIKYNRPAGSITLSAAPHERGWIRVSVIDNGVGIPAARHDEVFQPFNRLGAEGGSIEGTGIGLTICKRLIVQMGGRIGFESEPGRGSHFWILIPRSNGQGSFWRDQPPPDDGEAAMP